jgi:hypothetical protein
MIVLPEDYIITKFFQYAYQPKHNRYNNTYQAGCCICREGDSLGKKRRCYYIPKNDIIFCHNCGWSSKPFTWIKRVSNCETIDIINDLKDYEYTEITFSDKEELPVLVPSETLPKDCINLSDSMQIDFYKDNAIVQQCLELIKARRLDTAVNRPRTLYLSLADKNHKNRLVIPFLNEDKDIEFYQTRGFLEKDLIAKPKYISKINAEKTLFNIDQVSSDYDSVYIFEGPINAFFTKNSLAVGGITDKSAHTFTTRQQYQIDTTLKWFRKIWVLDSQWIDTTALTKSELLLQNGQDVFIWPEKFGKRFKDFNDICIACKIDEISHDFVQKNTFNGIEGILKLAEIKRFKRI